MSYDIRQSQLIHTWPSGSMIDFPDISLIMLSFDDSHEDWGVNSNGDGHPNQKNIIKDNRLAEAFKVDHFITPPPADGVNNLRAWSIRFPRSQYCPKCNLIHFINRDMGTQNNPKAVKYNQAMEAFFCDDCFNNQSGMGPKLIPMRFVIATEEGFLDDFPWDWFVHKKQPQERKKGHKLYLKSKGGSAGLGDIYVESYSNGKSIAKENLERIFEQEIFTEVCPLHGHYLNYVKAYMPKPWKGWHDNNCYVQELISDIPNLFDLKIGDDLTDKAKRKFPRTMQRGAGNIIFPIVYSGILLPHATYEQQCPPDVQQRLDHDIVALKGLFPDYQAYTNAQWRDFFINKIEENDTHALNKLNYHKNELKDFIRNHFGENPDELFVNKASLLRRQEFKAFTGNYLVDDKIWFRKKNIPGLEYNNRLSTPDVLDEVILLEKISALKVYKGFTRVKPLSNEELVFAEKEDSLDADRLYEFQRIQDARKDPVNTRELPAVEVKGEGIFLKFNNNKLNSWANDYPNARLKTINDNLVQSNAAFGQEHHLITKRYLFLHTFSHIILKELAEDCGYSLSSLAEIIYCSTEDEIGTSDEMNGILIYTTTSDSEGSLGGLVEKGDPKYFCSVIKKGIDKSRWCSSDPLCISSNQGQGFMGLNLAACYSCVLLPETSCEKMNKYLDRGSIIGTLNSPEIGFFNQNSKT